MQFVDLVTAIEWGFTEIGNAVFEDADDRRVKA